MGSRSKQEPRAGERMVQLDLGYGKADLESRTGEVRDGQAVTEALSPAELTRRMLAFAVNQNNREGLAKKEGRMWARIQQAMRSGKTATLSPEQFDWLFEQVEKCRYPAVSAEAAVVVWDHLEEVKLGRSADAP